MVFIEAARYLGFGARFVSGYLYDPALDKGTATQAVAATHARAEVYLPGAGRIEYDPTDVVIAGENLRHGRARPFAGHPDLGQLYRLGQGFPRHEGRGDDHRRANSLNGNHLIHLGAPSIADGELAAEQLLDRVERVDERDILHHLA